MRGQVVEGGIVAGILVFLSNHFEEIFSGLFNVVAFMVQNWFILCVILWIFSSGIYMIFNPRAGPIDAFGTTLYAAYSFFFVMIPTPVTLFGGFTIGADPVGALIIFAFNMGKLVAGFIFHLFLGISLFNYTWSLITMGLQLIGAFN